MDRIILSPHFKLDELIPKEIYMKFYDKSKQFLDPKGIEMIETIRIFFNTHIVINDWWNQGKLNYCGYRPPNCKVGAEFSQHKFGRGFDLHFALGTDYNLVRKRIKDNFEYFKEHGLTTIEKDTPEHLHVDCRWTGMDKLYEVEKY